MLTEKEIKFLNFLYKKLGGEHLDWSEASKYIREKIGLNRLQSFELAFLYDKNFNKANGNFKNVELIAVMQITQDYTAENYNVQKMVTSEISSKFDYYQIIHNGTLYLIFNNLDGVIHMVVEEYKERVCQNPEDYIPYTLWRSYIERPDRHNIAIDGANKWIENNLKTDEDVVVNGNIKEEYDNLNRTKEKLNTILGKLINLTSLMDDYLKLHRLGKEEEEQEEYIKLKKQINQYIEYINAVHNKIMGGSVIKDDMTIEEITNEVDEILYEIDYQIEDLIENTKNEIRETKFDDIYNQLNSSNPYPYFSEFLTEENYLRQDFVKVDCGLLFNQFKRSVDSDSNHILNFIVYSWYILI